MQTNPTRRTAGLSRLLPFLKPQLKNLVLCLLMVLLVNAAELIKPYILEIVIDRYLTAGRPDSGWDAVWFFALSYLLCAALSSLLSVTEAVKVNRMGQSILMDIRRRVFTHIQHMSMATLDRFSSGRLVTRATNDVETLNELFSDVLVNLFKDIFMLIGIVAVMLWINWRLALAAFAVVPLIALITVLVRGRLRRNFVLLKSLTGRINGFFAENMSGMRLVQIFRKEKEKHDEFSALNTAYYHSARTQVRMNSLMRPLVEVVNQLGIAILIWYGCKQIGLGTLEIGVLYAFTNYIKQFFDPINDLAEKYTTISSAVVSTDRIFELLDDDAQLEDTVSGQDVPKVCGRVEFRHVWFAYTGENWVLKDVSFTVEPGQSFAFVGETGAGKSTIISLLSRFYAPQKGQILLDGRDISLLSLEQLRRHVAVVLQDVFLFSGSISENVRLGNREITDEQVDRALRLACARDFIDRLPQGMDTPVTERGSTFSAGQRQLLSFARAIAHDPAVFVLDEATASIDTETEQLIQRSVTSVSRGRTTLIIAHRLSTIRACDCICVLHDGRIVEQGNHARLLSLNGAYARLCRAQSEQE
jgi:ATP-binding cassette subfamily B protein